MGLSASQARLLSLTSRLSSLELQAQSISNSKSRLADEGTAASKAYSDALEKQTMKVYSGTNPDGVSIYKDATANNLTSPGAVSDTDKQRFIKNQSGQLLVNDVVLAAYNTSGGKLENFLNGLSLTASSPAAKQQIFETTLTNNLTASVASASSLMTTRTDTVPSGQYTPVLGFSTNYNDSAIFQALNSINPTNYKANPTASNVVCFYSNSDNNSTNDFDMTAATAALMTEVSGVTSATTTALTSVLQNAFGSKWSLVADQITAAAQRAETDTKNFYNSKESTYVNFSGNTDNTAAVKVLDANTNDIYDDSYGSDELYIDRSEEVKTFLSFFDQECQNINGNQSVGTTGTYSDETNGSITQSANKATKVPMSYSMGSVYGALGAADTPNVVFFYQDGSDNSSNDVNKGAAWSALAGQLNGVTGSTANAVLSVLRSSYGSDWANILPQLTAAINQAQTNTTNFYYDQCMNYQTYSGHDDNNTVTIAMTAGTSQVWNDSHGLNELYVDQNQEIKTFLSYFDQARAGIMATTYSSVSETDGSTNRPATGSGTGSSNNVVGHEQIMTQVTVADSNASSVSMQNALQSISDSLNAISSNFGDVASISTYKNNLDSIISALKGGASVSDEAVNIKPLLESIPGTTTLKPAMDQVDITSKFAQYNYDSSSADYYEAVFDQLKEGGGFTTSDDNMNNSQWLQTQITAGNLYLYENDKNGDTVNISWTSGDSTLQEETNDSDVARAEAKYQTTMADISAKDNKFDLQLKNIDTEHTAIQTEVSSVNKVIEKNIDKSFKMFDA